MRDTLVTSLLLAAQLGCSSGSVEAHDSASPAVTSPPTHATEAAPAPKQQTMRVLVTGFNDWRELGDPPNVWRCRDNPSCRLLLGQPHDQVPSDYPGPLVTRLRRRAPEIDWSFATLPVTWESFADVPQDFDVIINLGLGVYDRFDALQLEAGAYNLRRGADAAGHERSEAIAVGGPERLEVAAHSPIRSRIDALAGRTLAGYEIVVAQARPENSYLCNETHFHALTAVNAGGSTLREAYFLHIPYAEHDDYEALAEGVAAVVLNLVARP